MSASISPELHVRSEPDFRAFYLWTWHGLTALRYPLQRVTSLRRSAQVNACAASYWLRRSLDDGERRDYIDESIAKGVPGAEPAMHPSCFC